MTKNLKFHEAADAAREPKGEYANAREVLDDLPAIIKNVYGPSGVNVANHMLIRLKRQWHRSGRQWFDSMVTFARRALQNEDLATEDRACWECVAVIGWAIEEAEKEQVGLGG